MALKIIGLGVAAALAAGAPAQAETWWMGAANTGAAFIDVDRTTTAADGKRLAQVHAVLPKGTAIAGREAAVLVVTFAYDCRAGTQRQVGTVSFGPGGEPIQIDNEWPPNSNPTETPSPNSVPYKNMMLACAPADPMRALWGRKIGRMTREQMILGYRR